MNKNITKIIFQGLFIPLTLLTVNCADKTFMIKQKMAQKPQLSVVYLCQGNNTGIVLSVKDGEMMAELVAQAFAKEFPGQPVKFQPVKYTQSSLPGLGAMGNIPGMPAAKPRETPDMNSIPGDMRMNICFKSSISEHMSQMSNGDLRRKANGDNMNYKSASVEANVGFYEKGAYGKSIGNNTYYFSASKRYWEDDANYAAAEREIFNEFKKALPAKVKELADKIKNAEEKK